MSVAMLKLNVHLMSVVPQGTSLSACVWRHTGRHVLYILNICNHENTFVSICSIFNIHLVLPFQFFFFHVQTWHHPVVLVLRVVSLHKHSQFCISSFSSTNQLYKTHTRSLTHTHTHTYTHCPRCCS